MQTCSEEKKSDWGIGTGNSCRPGRLWFKLLQPQLPKVDSPVMLWPGSRSCRTAEAGAGCFQQMARGLQQVHLSKVMQQEVLGHPAHASTAI